MPTFKFHCDRGVPGTSCMPMLAALGAASLGFEVSYARIAHRRPPGVPDNMMPDFLTGVDVVRHACEGIVPNPSAKRDLCVAEGFDDPHVVRILDAPLALPGTRREDGVGAIDCLVAGSLALAPLSRDPAPIRLACDAIGRNGMRRSWDTASSSWRLEVPALTPAELASLLRGAPMPRPMAMAGELARSILCFARVPQVPSSRYAWPAASRRPPKARNGHLPASTFR